jgi:hypothetical protein
MRIVFKVLAAVAAMVSPVLATTLQKLALEDMIRLSTTVVRARVSGSYAAARGADIYTFYQLSVLETLKAAGRTPSEVAVPGGAARGLRQLVEGAPELKIGEEYVLFLWTSPSGLTQVIGLSQGLFSLNSDGSGNPMLMRPAAASAMVDSNGRAVPDQSLSLRLGDLRGRIQKSAGVSK